MAGRLVGSAGHSGRLGGAGGWAEASDPVPSESSGRGSLRAGCVLPAKAKPLGYRAGRRELPAGVVLMSLAAVSCLGHHSLITAFLRSLCAQSTGSLSPPWRKM